MIAGETGRLTDADIDALLAKHAIGTGEKWHSDMLAVTDELLKRGCDTYTIRRAIADACKGGINDRDIGPLIDKRWFKLLEQKQEAERATASENAPKTSAGVL
jgi:hypothetical protein